MGKTKVETLFPDDAVAELFKMLGDLPSGKRTGRVVQEWAKKRGGHYVSEKSALNTIHGPFDDYLKELKAKSDRAQQVAAYAREGLSMSEAASVRLSESVFDELMTRNPASFTAEERDIYSKIISRARAGDDRAAKLAADLKLRDEQVARLIAERQERAEKSAQAKAALGVVKARGGLTKETLAKIEEAAGLL